MEEDEDVVGEDTVAAADMEGAVVEAMVRIYSCHEALERILLFLLLVRTKDIHLATQRDISLLKVAAVMEVAMEAEGVAADMEEVVVVMEEAVTVVVVGSEVAVEAAAMVVEEEAIKCALKWSC